MDTRKVLIIAALIIVLAGIGWLAISQSNGGDSMMQEENMMEKTDDAMMKDEGAMMEKDGDALTQ